MEISPEFINNSIFSEWVYEALTDGTGIPNDIYNEMMEALFESYVRQADTILQIIQYLRAGNYAEARKSLGFRDGYSYYPKDISMLRYNIKFLLSGLIKTSAIHDISEVKELVTWCGGRSGIGWDSPAFQNILREFKEVTTLEELSKFNACFQNYLIGMVFELSALFICRITYTIRYHRDDHSMEKVCNDLSIHSEKFREEIEKLKAADPKNK